MLDSSVQQQPGHASTFWAAQQPLEILKRLVGARVVDPMILGQVGEASIVVEFGDGTSLGAQV